MAAMLHGCAAPSAPTQLRAASATSVFTATTLPPTATQTPRFTATRLAEEVIEQHPSPNQQYVAELIDIRRPLHPTRPAVQVVTGGGELVARVPFKGEIPDSYPRPWMLIIGWSPDSSRLYFCDEWSPDGGNFAFWWTGYHLRSIDVSTGTIETVIDGDGFVSLGFSPDGTRLAYTREHDEPKMIHIRELRTGQEERVPVIEPSTPYELVGDLHWAHGAQLLAYQTQDQDSHVQTVVLDLATMQQRVVRQYMPFDAWLLGWLGNDQLEYEQEGGVARLALASGSITVHGTATPSPGP